MSIFYSNCQGCGVEVNDCACEVIYWHCSGCDATFCDDCVKGRWVACQCSGADYCPACMAKGKRKLCRCGVFGCWACAHPKEESRHHPGCPVRDAQR